MINSHQISLRLTTVKDLEEFFQFQLDREGIYLAAFTPKDPTDKIAYIAKYTKHLEDPTITTRTIMVDKQIVGSIAKFVIENDAEITYWIDLTFWGQGIASVALKEFLSIENTRPVFGRVAFDNFGSQKVLKNMALKKSALTRVLQMQDKWKS